VLFHGSIERVSQHFEKQFGYEHGRHVYRRGGRGPAIPISLEERDGLKMAFARGIRRLWWILLVATITVDIAWEIFFRLLPPDIRDDVRPAALGVLILVFIAWWWRLRNAPERLVGRRTPIGNPLEGYAARRADLALLPWSILLFGAVICVALLWRLTTEPHPLRDYPGSAIAGTLSLTVLTAVVWLKWRASR
jgi:hypothetical protein